MTIIEKVAYMKGLAEGMDIGDNVAGKLFVAIIDVLSDMAAEIEELNENALDIGEELDAISDDLADVEEFLEDLDVDEDEDEDEDDLDTDDDDFDYDDKPVVRRNTNYGCEFCGRGNVGGGYRSGNYGSSSGYSGGGGYNDVEYNSGYKRGVSSSYNSVDNSNNYVGGNDDVYEDEDDDNDDGFTIDVNCPECGTDIELDEDDIANESVTCPTCKNVIELDIDEDDFDD